MATVKAETPEKLAARKAAEFERMLANGWHRDELRWAHLPGSRSESLSRGGWCVSHDGVERRLYERFAQENYE